MGSKDARGNENPYESGAEYNEQPAGWSPSKCGEKYGNPSQNALKHSGSV